MLPSGLVRKWNRTGPEKLQGNVVYHQVQHNSCSLKGNSANQLVVPYAEERFHSTTSILAFSYLEHNPSYKRHGVPRSCEVRDIALDAFQEVNQDLIIASLQKANKESNDGVGAYGDKHEEEEVGVADWRKVVINNELWCRHFFGRT